MIQLIKYLIDKIFIDQQYFHISNWHVFRDLWMVQNSVHEETSQFHHFNVVQFDGSIIDECFIDFFTRKHAVDNRFNNRTQDVGNQYLVFVDENIYGIVQYLADQYAESFIVEHTMDVELKNKDFIKWNFRIWICQYHNRGGKEV